MKKKRGRPQIGARVCFACPDEVYDYVYWYGKEHGLDDWTDALRKLIRDHEKNLGTGKCPIKETTELIN